MFYGKTTYNIAMNTFRRFGLNVATFLFSVCISLIALLVSLHFVIDTPQPLKQVLSTSGIYDTPIQDVLAGEEGLSSSLPLTDPGVQQALKEAVPPAFLQRSSEQALDSVYSWVQGNASELNFSIDLNPVKTDFANNIARYVRQKLDALPPCTHLIAPPTTSEEVLAMTCMPRGISSVTIANTARQEALDSRLFSENNTISPSTLKDRQGNPLTDRLAFIPTLHRYYVLSLYVLPLFAVVCAVAIFFWSITKRAGIKRIGWLLISAGIVSMIIAAIEVWFLHTGATLLGMPAATSPTIQDKLFFILETLASNLRSWWFGFGAGYALLGIVLLIILRFNRSKPTLTMGAQRNERPTASL